MCSLQQGDAPKRLLFGPNGCDSSCGRCGDCNFVDKDRRKTLR